MDFTLNYVDWSESQGKALSDWGLEPVSGDELFVRKLVDGTLRHNQLWNHLSNESEGEHHTIYVVPYEEAEIPQLSSYKRAIASKAMKQCSITSLLTIELVYWNGTEFMEREGEPYRSLRALDIAGLLLDHYWTINHITFEILYSIMDLDRKKIVFFLKREEEFE